MKVEATSVRLPSGTLRRLRALASAETLLSGERVTVSQLLRLAVEEKLSRSGPGLVALGPQDDET
jgi:hypothetical protein